VQPGQRRTLFYSHNTLNPRAANAADFLAEAQAEYPDEMSDEGVFRVEAAVWWIREGG
jgi:hypothetical protein